MRTKRLILLVSAPLVLAELAARLYFVSIPSALYVDREGVLPEAMAEQSALKSEWDERGFWYSYRETLPAVQADHTVYMIGTSITQGELVRSDETIASYLQRRLNAYRVVNLGAPAQTSAGMLRQIKSLSLKLRDVVIMEGVTMDAEGAFFAQEKQARKCAPLAIAQLWCLPRPNEVLDESIAQETLKNIQLSHASVEARGAGFFYVIMPYFYSTEAISQRERYIQAQYAPVVEAVYRSAWECLYAVAQIERGTLDLSNLLDNQRRIGQSFYHDIWHFDEQGNAIVARAIADVIAPTF